MFEGIGAISGGGATSKLLVQYKAKELNEVLELLFKPGYAASLHSLKVEIGGDSQSTEGTEASHMHNQNDLDCSRGYEGWLMSAVKKINPNVILHGLPWAFPGWLGVNRDPYRKANETATYISKWISCMKDFYNLRIDSVGIWNEHPYDIKYIKTLRHILNARDQGHVKIVASDNDWAIAEDMIHDRELTESIHAIGAHYPGTKSSSNAQKLGTPLWASEDYSTFNNDVGSGCWARILNQNYVNGLMTSTIAWNLVAAYSDALPFPRCSLMTANEPWSGHYEVKGPVWITAHTTQFTRPGWHYLEHGRGVGYLSRGGSYVSFVSPDRKHLTIVLESMTHDNSFCIRPALPPFSVRPQNVTLQIIGDNGRITELYIWRTKLRFERGMKSDYFMDAGKISVTEGKVTLLLDVDELITLTTVKRSRSAIPKPAKSTPLQLPYHDDFQIRSVGGIREPEYLAPQVGYFELVPDPDSNSGTRTILQQMVTIPAVDWCDIGRSPIALMGYGQDWANVQVSVSAYILDKAGSDSVFVAARVQSGGCGLQHAQGVFGSVNLRDGKYRILTTLSGAIVASGDVELHANTWYNLMMDLQDNLVSLYLNGKRLTSLRADITGPPGMVGLGCGSFGYARFANFSVTKSQRQPFPLVNKSTLSMLERKQRNKFLSHT